MIGALLLLVIAVVPTHEQSTPVSPCPHVFTYEPGNTEKGRWYGVLNFTTDTTMHSLMLNIVLDGKADLLGNYVGYVTSTDNKGFQIENMEMKIHRGQPTSVRFFVKYDVLQKAPLVREIKLNGREICNVKRPVEPVYKPTTNPTDQNVVNSYSSDGTRDQAQSVTEKQTTTHKFTRKPYYTTQDDDDDDDDDIGRKIDPAEYWSPGQSYILYREDTSLKSGEKTARAYHGKTSQTNNRNQPQCGQVTKEISIPLIVYGKPTWEGQWPWQIALYRTLSATSIFICGGTLISHKHVITVAHCVTRKGSVKPINKDLLTIYLGKHNLRKSEEGVQIRLVSGIAIYPAYNTNLARDLSILTMREPVEYTDYVRAACLWPEDQIALRHVVGKIGSVVGWGTNEEGMTSEELTLVEMPVVTQETCLRSHRSYVKLTNDYTYCAGFRDGTSVCKGDSGGGMVFEMNDTWYLRGLVSLSIYTPKYICDPTNYVIFTDVAKYLPWIKDQIGL